MTNITYTKGEYITLEGLNHAGDRDLCTIISTACNVLAIRMEKRGIEPEIYEPGHFKITIPHPTSEDIAVADAVAETISAAGVEVITREG